MTATTVHGLDVVATEPALSPLSKPGSPVRMKQIVKLELANGDEVYGCVHCDYVAASAAHVRPHLKVHKPKKATATANGSMTVAELVTAAGQLDALNQAVDHWKARALKAERSLSVLRRALNG